MVGNPSPSIEPIKAVFSLSIMLPTVFSASLIILLFIIGLLSDAKVEKCQESNAIKRKVEIALFTVCVLYDTITEFFPYAVGSYG